MFNPPTQKPPHRRLFKCHTKSCNQIIPQPLQVLTLYSPGWSASLHCTRPCSHILAMKVINRNCVKFPQYTYQKLGRGKPFQWYFLIGEVVLGVKIRNNTLKRKRKNTSLILTNLMWGIKIGNGYVYWIKGTTFRKFEISICAAVPYIYSSLQNT